MILIVMIIVWHLLMDSNNRTVILNYKNLLRTRMIVICHRYSYNKWINQQLFKKKTNRKKQEGLCLLSNSIRRRHLWTGVYHHPGVLVRPAIWFQPIDQRRLIGPLVILSRSIFNINSSRSNQRGPLLRAVYINWRSSSSKWITRLVKCRIVNMIEIRILQRSWINKFNQDQLVANDLKVIFMLS